jgi:hypothetical protein
MEISDIRKRINAAIDRAKRVGADRRARTDEAARAYSAFLDTIAVPMFRQVANVLRAEGYPFGVFTPSGSVKLVSDRTAADSIEIVLDTSGDEPRVMGHTTRTRGNRVIESERPVGDPATLTESDLLDFLMQELEALFAR